MSAGADIEIRNLSLRILYTINSSPQYILARSSSLAPVTLIPHVQTRSYHDKTIISDTTIDLEPRFHYATVSLKACLDAICRSSPELIQDFSRDFSVYVLDPLESNSAPAPVNITSTIDLSFTKANVTAVEPSRGVAVGLGLMSWALLADESDGCTVTGTLIKLANGQEALEVIFALRETATMPKASLPATLQSWKHPPESSKLSNVYASNCESKHPIRSSASAQYLYSSGQSSSTSAPSRRQATCSTDVATLATIASIQMRVKHRRTKPKKSVKPPPAIHPNSEADRLMLAEDIYIGPVKKKGRPVRINGMINAESPQEINSAVVSVVSNRSVDAVTEMSLEDLSNSSRISSLDPVLKTHQSKANLESFSHKHASSLPIELPKDPIVSDRQISKDSGALLDILTYLTASASSDEPVQTAALLAPLGAIDSGPVASESAVSGKIRNQALINALMDLLSAVSEQDLSHPIENAVSALQNNFQHVPQSPDDEVVLLDKENINPGAFQRRNKKDTMFYSTQSSPLRNSSVSTISGSLYTPVQGDNKAHTRSLSNRSSGTNGVELATSCDVIPSRKRTLSNFMDEREAEKDKRKTKRRERVEQRDAHRHARSSRFPAVDLSPNRHYPRIMASDLPQKRSGTHSYYKTGLEPWTSPPKQRENNAQRKRSLEQAIVTPDFPQALRISASSPVRKSVQSHRPYVVPAWARTETSTQPRLSQEAQRALDEAQQTSKQAKGMWRKKSSKQTERENRKRAARSSSPTRSTEHCITTNHPGKVEKAQDLPQPIAATNDFSIFTVTPIVRNPSPSTPRNQSTRLHPWLVTSNMNLPSTPPRKRPENLFSPTEDASLFTPLSKSYDSNAHDSIASPFYGKLDSVSPRATDEIKSIKGREPRKEVGADDAEKILNHEPDSAFGELDLPSSSLPNVSSDIESSERAGSFQESFKEDYGRDEPITKQHWIGLPPSSPPPPSSPLLVPQGDDSDSDDRELPIATSEAEDCTLDADEQMPPSSPRSDLSTGIDDELVRYLNNKESVSFFPDMDQSIQGVGSPNSGMNIFNQFTTNCPPALSDSNQDLDNSVVDMFEGGLSDFDFTEFWQTFRPLVELNTNSLDNEGSLTGMDLDFGLIGDVQAVNVMEELNHAKLAEDVQALFSDCLA